VAEQPPFVYGGQAVIEGVMIRGRQGYSVAARRPDGEICAVTHTVPGWGNNRLRRIPLVRGTLVLAESMVIGMKALTYSAQVAAGEEDDEKPIPPWAIALTLLFSLGIAISLFFVLPLVLVHSGVDRFTDSSIVSNVAEGVIRLTIFVAYLLLVGSMPSIRRVFGYHAAEHMAVHANEHELPLNIANVRRFPAAHPRCGTAFLLTVMVVSILVFALLGKPDLPLRLASRIVLIPVIAGVSYEFLRFSAAHSGNVLVRALMSPNLWLQKLTTRAPDDGQVEVAISAMERALEDDLHHREGAADASSHLLSPS